MFVFCIKHSKAVVPFVDERTPADGVELLEEDLGDPGLVLSRRVAAHNTVLVSLPFCNSKDTIPKLELYIPRKGTAQPQFQILHSCFCVQYIYIFSRSVCIFCCRKIGGLMVRIYKPLTDTGMWKLGLRPRSSFSVNTFQFNLFEVRTEYTECQAFSPVVRIGKGRGSHGRRDRHSGTLGIV